MRRSLVVGNWKMHGTRQGVDKLVTALLASLKSPAAEVALCPPFMHIARVVELVAGHGVGVGGQDCSPFESGAYTGEVAAAMLVEAGCDRVILGHSERRARHGESDADVAAKAAAARKVGLCPILCLGETLAEREAGEAEAVVARQLDALIAGGLFGCFRLREAYDDFAFLAQRCGKNEEEDQIENNIQ